MIIVNNMAGAILGNSRERRTASKTVRKYTGYYGQDSLPSTVSISLDWLSFMVVFFLRPPAEGETVRHIGESVVMEYTGHGTPVFNHVWDVYYDGEPWATLMSHSRSEKVIPAGVCKIEIKNHILYSSWLDGFNALMEDLGVESIKNISRLDIAMDGANHIPVFLNKYVKQRLDRQQVKMLGKASFDAKRMNANSLEFVNFKVGPGHKQVTVYNKTQELGRSHKEYIRDAWKVAGLDIESDQWRTELRLKSQAIKELSYISGTGGDGAAIRTQGVDLQQLGNPMYLMEIFRTSTKNFFEFVKIDNDSNASRARIIDLLQFEKLKINILDKIPRAVVRGAYKAKMSIHNAIMCVLLNMFDTAETVHSALLHVLDNVQLYRLDRYYQKKLPEWIAAYQPIQKDDGNMAKIMAIGRNFGT